MNAEVTAENKPDCAKLYDQPNPLYGSRINTHKDERGIQIFIVFLLKIPVVFLHFSLKLVVELHSGVGTNPGAPYH